MNLRKWLLVPILPTLFGCASKQVVSEPSEITLENAVSAVVKALKQLQETEKDIGTGLIPSEVVLTFNITASGTDDQNLRLELAPSNSNQSAKWGTEATSTASADRGNQITITFSNLLLADDKTLIANKTPEEIKASIETLKEDTSTPKEDTSTPTEQ